MAVSLSSNTYVVSTATSLIKEGGAFINPAKTAGSGRLFILESQANAEYHHIQTGTYQNLSAPAANVAAKSHSPQFVNVNATGCPDSNGVIIYDWTDWDRTNGTAPHSIGNSYTITDHNIIKNAMLSSYNSVINYGLHTDIRSGVINSSSLAANTEIVQYMNYGSVTVANAHMGANSSLENLLSLGSYYDMHEHIGAMTDPDSHIHGQGRVQKIDGQIVTLEKLHRTVDAYKGATCLLYTSPSPRD